MTRFSQAHVPSLIRPSGRRRPGYVGGRRLGSRASFIRCNGQLSLDSRETCTRGPLRSAHPAKCHVAIPRLIRTCEPEFCHYHADSDQKFTRRKVETGSDWVVGPGRAVEDRGRASGHQYRRHSSTFLHAIGAAYLIMFPLL